MKDAAYHIAQDLVVAPGAPDIFLIKSKKVAGGQLEISSNELRLLSHFTSPTSIHDAVVAFSKKGFVVEETLYNLIETLVEAGFLIECMPEATQRTHDKQKQSKLLARSLEVNVTSHCNLSCYGCDHAAPLHTKDYVSPESLGKDLSVLSKIYHAVDFKLTGGEPLLHTDLLSVIDIVRASKISDTITLFTNGVLLDKAPAELWSRVDTMYVSIYPGVNPAISDDDMISLAEKHDTHLIVVEMDTFLLKLLNNENGNSDLVRYIFSNCGLKAACHTIHAGKYYTCSPSPFVPGWLERLGVDVEQFSSDGIQIQGNPTLHKDLQKYLLGDEPLKACRYCLGTMGLSTPCRQMNHAALESWLAEDHSDIFKLIDWKRLAERSSLSRLIGVN